MKDDQSRPDLSDVLPMEWQKMLHPVTRLRVRLRLRVSPWSGRRCCTRWAASPPKPKPKPNPNPKPHPRWAASTPTRRGCSSSAATAT
eukprot:scaffold74913_cov59-Phaeocystis_antarctica.AAC.2